MANPEMSIFREPPFTPERQKRVECWDLLRYDLQSPVMQVAEIRTDMFGDFGEGNSVTFHGIYQEVLDEGREVKDLNVELEVLVDSEKRDEWLLMNRSQSRSHSDGSHMPDSAKRKKVKNFALTHMAGCRLLLAGSKDEGERIDIARIGTMFDRTLTRTSVGYDDEGISERTKRMMDIIGETVWNKPR